MVRFAAPTLLALASAGCVRQHEALRPSFGGSRAPSGALIFDSAEVRAGLDSLGASLDELRPEYARNDARMGVRTRAQSRQERFYRSSDWFGPPYTAPGAFHRHVRPSYGDTIPLLSPARERSWGIPY